MKELNCKDCIHHDACADWADTELAKRYWGGRLLKDIIDAVGDEGPSPPTRPTA